MKTLTFLFFILCLLPTSARAGDLRIGIVDMSRVFAEFHKTKAAEEEISSAKAVSKKELDGRQLRLKTLIGKYQELAAQIKDPGISEELRAGLQKQAQDVAAEARSLEQEIHEFARRRERQLLEQLGRMRKALMEEIQTVVAEYARLQNYDLVFDKSGLGASGVPILQYSREAVDFSAEIVRKLNASEISAK